MKPLLFALLAFAIIGTSAFGDDFRKGSEAAQNGDFATALRLWKPLAENGHPEAQFYLGKMYLEGAGVKKNDKTAFN